MTICVFGASSTELGKEYIEPVEIMGCELAKNGHNLVFGAGGTGLMGAAARGFKMGGAHIKGVIPNFFRDKERVVEPVYDGCDEVIYTETMRERKAIMEENADAFIIVPGGIGTYEEFFEIATLKELGRHNKPIAILNLNGYYDLMLNMIDDGIKKEFIRDSVDDSYAVFDNVKDIVEYFQ